MKKFICLFALVIVLLMAFSIQAQQWTDQQKEVWKTVQTYNDLSANRDPGFLDYFDDTYHGWEYEADAPDGKEAVKIYISNWDPNIKTLFVILNPATIWVNGNFAYVHYYYTTIREDKDGKRKSEKGRWTDILMKKDGKWVMVGDHGGSTSDDD